MIHEWLGIPAGFIAWGFAFYVYIVAPSTRGARYLIGMLVVDGLAVISSGSNSEYINPFLTQTLGLPALDWGEIHQASDWAVVAVYLPFLGMTLASPLVGVLKNKIVSNAVLYGGLAIAASMLFLSEEAREHFRVPFYAVISVVLAWGFIAAIHSWYIATSDAIRDRARAFMLAFGARDVLWTITFGTITLYHFGLVGDGGFPEPTSMVSIVVAYSYQIAVILYVPLVAYGVLRVQLFDVDLRIKRTIRRSTIAAAFVATFFIVSELAGEVLSSQLGTVLGVVCTGLLVFFLDPIQRAAERVSNAAMPNTHATPEYESFRKLQVYETAVHAALEDGHISKRQRRVLDSMIQSMGIDADIANQLEQDALERQ